MKTLNHIGVVTLLASLVAGAVAVQFGKGF